MGNAGAADHHGLLDRTLSGAVLPCSREARRQAHGRCSKRFDTRGAAGCGGGSLMGQFFQPQDLGAIGPELELALFGMIVLVFDLLVKNKRVLGYVSLVGLAWSGYFLFRLRTIVDAPAYAGQVFAYGGHLALDPFAWFFKGIALIAAALAVAISL